MHFVVQNIIIYLNSTELILFYALFINHTKHLKKSVSNRKIVQNIKQTNKMILAVFTGSPKQRLSISVNGNGKK